MRRIKIIISSIVPIMLVLLSANAIADDSVVDEINITVPVSCTMSGTGMTSHNADITNGTSNSAIGETTIKAFCNDNTGFSIYAIGYTDNEDGKNVLTNSTLGSTYDIVTGTVTGPVNNVDTSNWAMKLSTITDPAPTYPIIIAGSTADTDKETGDLDYSSFQEVPDDYTKVAYRKSSTDIGTNAEGSTLKTTYQAYISKTQPAGTYSGQVKYTLVHPYDTEAPFACKPNGTTISTIVCMQDISSTNKSTILASMVEEQQYTLRDKRDGKTYTVSKLKDGNIWMTQNLDLDLDSTKTYTNEDTDIGWNGTDYDVASWMPLRSTYLTGAKTWCQGGTWDSQYNNNCDDNYTPESYDPGDSYWNGVLSNYSDWGAYRNSCIWDSITYELTCDESLNPIATYITVSGTTTPEYHLGNYYNWTAAVAMNDSSDYPLCDSGTGECMNLDIDQSICPTGWTLPRSGSYTSSGSFEYLFGRYNWVPYEMTNPYIWNSAIKMFPSGVLNGLLENVGYDGQFQSSVLSSYAYNPYVAEVVSEYGYVAPDNAFRRADGVSVRCVAR